MSSQLSCARRGSMSTSIVVPSVVRSYASMFQNSPLIGVRVFSVILCFICIYIFTSKLSSIRFYCSLVHLFCSSVCISLFRDSVVLICLNSNLYTKAYGTKGPEVYNRIILLWVLLALASRWSDSMQTCLIWASWWGGLLATDGHSVQYLVNLMRMMVSSRWEWSSKYWKEG